MAQFAQDLINAFTAGQNAQNQRMVMSARQQAMEDEQKQRKQQEEQSNDYRVAQREMAQGRPDVMQLGFPEQYRKIQTQELADQSTRVKMNEDRQQIRDKALEQGLTAASANPANWTKFVDYAEKNQIYDPGELDRNMTQEQALMGLGKLKAAKERAANPNQGFDRMAKLQGMYQSQPVVKQLQETERALVSINTAPDTIPGHMALVFGLMKLLDPSSVVRESEQAQAVNATGLTGRLANYANMLQGNVKLNPQQVAEMKAASAALTQAYRDIASKVSAPYKKLASDWGVDPDQVVLPFGFGEPQKQPQATNPMQNISDEDLAKIAGQQ